MAASADGVGVGSGAGVAGAVGESAVGVEASGVDAVTVLSAFLASVDVSDGGCASDTGGVTGAASVGVVGVDGVVSPFCVAASLGALLSLSSDATSGAFAARLAEGGVAGFSSFARSGRIRN